MSNIYKGEFQDYEGNVVYPHTTADVVFGTDGKTVQARLNELGEGLDGVTGRTDSPEVSDSNILATSKAVYSVKNTLQENFQAGVDSVYNAVVAKGSTPASKSLSDIITGIGNIKTGLSNIISTRLCDNSSLSGNQSYSYTATKDCFFIAVATSFTESTSSNIAANISSSGAVEKLSFGTSQARGSNYKGIINVKVYFMPKGSSVSINTVRNGYSIATIYAGKLEL